MSFFVSDALAAGASPSQGDSPFSFIMIAAIFVLFYFMLIRPQNKRAKEQKELNAKLKKGDEVITAGGILGKVSNLDDQYLKLTLAEGVDITVQRSAVQTVLPKGTLKSL